MSTKWCLILLLLSWSASQIHSIHIRASFGQACGPGLRCESRKSLSCIKNKCNCIKPEEMIYDEERGKCVAMAGEQCTHTTVHNTSPHGKRWTEKLDCVPNSRCHRDGYCRCESHYFETPPGSCSHKLIQGGNCTSHNQCRTDLQYFCRLGICSCDPTEAAFDPELQKCVAIAGTECSKYEDMCVPNAKCKSEKRHQYFDFLTGSHYLVQSPHPSHRKCECLPDFKKSKDGRCLGICGMTCGEDGAEDGELASCHEDFACINGKCSCPFPQHQEHDDHMDPCVSLVGGPCKEKINGSSDHFQEFQCVDHAHCNSTTSGIMECQCDQGYVESPERKCEIAHGGSCTPDGTPCDSTADLICRDGRCSCQDFQVYDQAQRKCRGLVGAQCATQDNILRYCVDGAMCQVHYVLRLTRFLPAALNWLGTCRCNSTLATTPDRTCSAGNDGPMMVTEAPKPSGPGKPQRKRKSKTVEQTTESDMAGASQLPVDPYDSEEESD